MRAEAGEEGAVITRSPTPPVTSVRKGVEKIPLPSAEGEVSYEEIEVWQGILWGVWQRRRVSYVGYSDLWEVRQRRRGSNEGYSAATA